MAAAEEFQLVRPGWAVWSAYEPTVRVELWSTALRTRAGWLLIDPIPLATAAFAELVGETPVVAIAMTNGNHARSCQDYRRRLRLPLWADPAAAEDAGLVADAALTSDRLPGLRVFPLPGAAPGEVALLTEDGVCVVGDALINLGSHPFQPLPDKYCTDPRELRGSLAALAREPGWDALGFAHGEPVSRGARERLRALAEDGEDQKDQ
ncbi:MAG: hypothetical protein JSR82_20620 [Verrucomicrobia bacterium]|nr:hypothetical protein [Verrucomicrobiota bacterium]